jgi:hypothetical protein
MLKPDERQHLMELLRPPIGCKLDAAVGTTYSLDLISALMLPLSFAFLCNRFTSSTGCQHIAVKANTRCSREFGGVREQPGNGRKMSGSQPEKPRALNRQKVASVDRGSTPAQCILANGTKLLLPQPLMSQVSPGDELVFSLSADAVDSAAELNVIRRPGMGAREFYHGAIDYAAAPKADKRGQWFVSAAVRGPGLGLRSIFLPCSVLSQYFYRIAGNDGDPPSSTFYDLLHISPTASYSELRVGFQLRQLELRQAGVAPAELAALERAFNIVGEPELRAVYDSLLRDPSSPAVFPYGGFGMITAAGERSRDGATFFVQRILLFVPECRQRGFRAPLRQCDFYDDYALYRDARRRLELWLDHALLHAVWDAAWNQWKHLLPTKMQVEATFVQCGKYRQQRGEWALLRWEQALPSHLHLKLPADFERQVSAAKTAFHRFGQYSTALEKIRLRLKFHAMERAELEKLCVEFQMPADFDVAQINWRPDYDPFYYQQLVRRARRTYLFRDEYIFDLEKAIVVETPQMGHATYLFAKPRAMETFLHLYTTNSKEDIRRNRNNLAERLGFLGRIIHGSNPRAWLKELKQSIGEKIDFATAVAEG